MTIIYYLFVFVFLFLALILCCVILMQESKSSGLGASFGSDTGDSLFGTSTPLILKKITAYLSLCFLVGCIILSVWTRNMGHVATSNPLSSEVIEE